ncbi:MAG: hypothetical protein GY757_36320, partial [bacterium]|nr:hypothetical protein [bacterium]
MNKELLNSKDIIETIHLLTFRIEERFPDSGLYKVGKRLHEISKETDATISWIEKPNKWFRFGMGCFFLAVLALLVYALSNLRGMGTFNLADFVTVTEAGVNEVVVLGAAIVFLISIESRTKRKKIIASINRLRSLAHVIDMHQLTKDPQSISEMADKTKHSPSRQMTKYQLARYLDYCSELLSLTSKVGFLYIQHFNDPV